VETLYLECSMGAAGDMLMAALLELIEDKAKFLNQINSLGFSNVKVKAKSVKKCGIAGTYIQVSINSKKKFNTIASLQHSHDNNAEFSNEQDHCENNHRHHNLSNKTNLTNIKKIESILAQLPVSQKIKDNAFGIYSLIAKAEASVHKRPVNYIHFHELGDIDALVDIIGTCILIERLKPKKIIVSPINVGSGSINCEHGILPVPAPATAKILRNIPIYNEKNVREELCTPTGAAIIRYFATNFGQLPKMRVKKIGYGMGTKDFEAANCVRAFLGETENSIEKISDTIVKLECNLDDMTGEAIGFSIDLLLKKGALDVFTTPIQMKKSRPAVLLTCICSEHKADLFAELMLRHTTTFGVRKTICGRYTLKRKTLTQQTPYGNIRVKIGEGYSIKKLKPEYDDILEAAHLNNVSFNEVVNAIELKYEYKTKI